MLFSVGEGCFMIFNAFSEEYLARLQTIYLEVLYLWYGKFTTCTWTSCYLPPECAIDSRVWGLESHYDNHSIIYTEMSICMCSGTPLLWTPLGPWSVSWLGRCSHLTEDTRRLVLGDVLNSRLGDLLYRGPSKIAWTLPAWWIFGTHNVMSIGKGILVRLIIGGMSCSRYLWRYCIVCVYLWPGSWKLGTSCGEYAWRSDMNWPFSLLHWGLPSQLWCRGGSHNGDHMIP